MRVRITAGTNDATAAAYDEESGEALPCSARLAHDDEAGKAYIIFAGEMEVESSALGTATLGEILASKLIGA